MKHTHLLLITLAFIIGACQSNKKQETQNPEPETKKDTAITAGVYHFSGDKFELWTLQDKQQAMPADLFPNARKEVIQELVPTGEADAAINTFLIKFNGEYILFDAGLGIDKGGTMLDKLNKQGISTADISAVCITHFHGDHIGGLLSGGRASFPNAKLYFSIREQEAFGNQMEIRNLLKAYEGRTYAFKDGESILNGIATRPAPGHTPGHTMYQIGNLLIIGDLIHAAALQIPHPELCAKYDQDTKKAVQSRKEGYKYIEDNHLIVAGMHLPNTGIMHNFPKE